MRRVGRFLFHPHHGCRRDRHRWHGRRRHFRRSRAVGADHQRGCAAGVSAGRPGGVIDGALLCAVVEGLPQPRRDRHFPQPHVRRRSVLRRDQRAVVAELHRDARPVFPGVRQLRRKFLAPVRPYPGQACVPHRGHCGDHCGQHRRRIHRGPRRTSIVAVKIAILVLFVGVGWAEYPASGWRPHSGVLRCRLSRAG